MNIKITIDTKSRPMDERRRFLNDFCRYLQDFTGSAFNMEVGMPYEDATIHNVNKIAQVEDMLEVCGDMANGRTEVYDIDLDFKILKFEVQF